MKHTIRSKKLGRDVTFSVPGESYIYVDLNGRPGTLGDQICRGGRLVGSTLAYDGDSSEMFAQICRKWWRKYLRNERNP